jgi:hypothetical protein
MKTKDVEIAVTGNKKNKNGEVSVFIQKGSFKHRDKGFKQEEMVPLLCEE